MMRTRFGKPRVRLTNKYDGQDDLRMHLGKWTQAYGERPPPEQMHMYSALKYLVNKPLLGGRICRWLLLFQEYDSEVVVKPG